MTDEFTQAVAELDSPVARMLEEKDAEIERLKAELNEAKSMQCTSPWPDSPPCRAIERLKAELAAETQRRWDGNRIASSEAAKELADVKKYCADAHTATHTKLAASQAREAYFRECLHNCYGVDEDGVEYINYATIKEALALPTDDTALKDAINLGQVEILLEAAEAIIKDAARIGSDWVSAHHADTLRKMADEL
jgi:hypothetical protein